MKTEETVHHIRLLNGDEIIGELVETTNSELLISKPMVVSEKEDPNTNISTIILSKYVLFEDDSAIPFQRNHVVTCTKVLPEIKKYYYNSVEFNNRFSEPVIRKEISRINNLMEGMLKAKNEAAVLEMAELDEETEDIRVITATHSSNTIH
jgi:hypothetical protein